MTDYVRIKYSGATPGGDSDDYVLYSTVTAFGGKCGHQMAGLHKLVISLFHTQAGTLKLYSSRDRGANWTQVRSQAVAIPGAGMGSSYETLVETFADFKLVWTNGGVAQATWYPDIALTDDRSLAGGSEASILALQPYSWAKLNYYSVDGVSGKVAAILDKVPAGTGIKAIDATHSFAQATSGNQIAIPAARASLGGRSAGFFNATPYYVSTAPASAWKGAHDGTGWTTKAVLDLQSVGIIQYVCSTYGPGSETGAGLVIVTSNAYNAVYNGATLTIGANAAAGGTGATFFTTTVALASSPDAVLFRRTTQIATADASVGFSSANPSGTMTIGANRSGSNPLNAYLGEVLCFNRVLTAADDAVVNAYIAAEYLL